MFEVPMHPFAHHGQVEPHKQNRKLVLTTFVNQTTLTLQLCDCKLTHLRANLVGEQTHEVIEEADRNAVHLLPPMCELSADLKTLF